MRLNKQKCTAGKQLWVLIATLGLAALLVKGFGGNLPHPKATAGVGQLVSSTRSLAELYRIANLRPTFAAQDKSSDVPTEEIFQFGHIRQGDM